MESEVRLIGAQLQASALGRHCEGRLCMLVLRGFEERRGIRRHWGISVECSSIL